MDNDNKPNNSSKSNKSTRFKKGKSGNPLGRPKRSVSLKEANEILLTVIPEVIYDVADQSHKGDLHASQLLLDRCLPILKAITPSNEFELTKENTPLLLNKLFAAAVNGQLTFENFQMLERIRQFAFTSNNLGHNGSLKPNVEINITTNQSELLKPSNQDDYEDGINIKKKKTESQIDPDFNNLTNSINSENGDK